MANNTEKRTVEIIMNGSQPAKTMKELNGDIRQLTATLRQLELGSEAWVAHNQKLKDLRSQYNTIQQEVRKTANSYEYLRGQMKGVAIGVIGGNLITSATQAITGYFTGAVDGIAKLSDELADIRKVTGLTAQEVDVVNSSISKIDTRTSRSELRALAYEAGKLGNESVEDVLGFVRAADVINIALGEDLGKDAITQIGKLSDIFKLKQEFGLEEGMLKIASAINDVGAASTANEKYLVDFASRMAGVAGIGKISAPELFGVAGALDSLGQSSEVSSTTLSKLLTKMGSDVKTFAKLAGMNVNDFKKVMDKSGMEALLLVIEQMGKSAGGLEQLSAHLGDIGLDGGRVVGVLGTLSKNMEMVREQTRIATDAFNEGNSVLNEYAIKNETTAAKIEKLQKKISSLKESKVVKQAIQSLIDGLDSFVNSLQNASRWYQKNKDILLVLIATWIAYNAIMLKNLAIQRTALAFQKTQNVLVNVAVIAIKAMILAEEVLSGKIKAKIALQRIYNALMLKNPYALAIAGVTALAGAIAVAISRQQKLKKEMMMKQIDLNVKVNSEELNELQDNYKKLKKELATASGDQLNLNKQLVDSNISANKESVNEDLKQLAELKKNLTAEEKKIDEGIKEMGRSKRDSVRMPNTDQLTLMKKEIEKREKLISQKQKTLAAWNQLNQQYINKIEEERQAAEEAAEEGEKLTKEELERLRKLNEDYIKVQEQLRKAKAQALVDAIEDEFQRELAQLRLNHQTKLEEIDKQIAEELALARQLGKGKEEIAKIYDTKKVLTEAETKVFERLLSAANTNKEKELADEEYNEEMDNLAKRQAGRQMLLNEWYQKNPKDKEKYEDEVAKLELEGKEILLTILQDYGKDVTEAELDISNRILAITKNKLEKRMALELAAAEQRVAIANMEVSRSQRTGLGNKDALQEKYEAENDLLLKQIASELGLTELTEQQIFDIKTKFAERFRQLDYENEVSHQERKKGIATLSMEVAQEAFAMIMDQRMYNLQQEMDQLETRYAKESELLEKQKQDGILSESEYMKRKEKMEDEYNKKQAAIKRKQAVAEKINALFNIAIQTAMNITSAFPNPVLMGIAGGLGALQMGIVAARKIPEFEKGTKLSDKLLSGPRHSSKHKGIHMIDPVTNRLVGLAEGGEVLLSRNTYANNKDIVDSLLHSSMYQNGKRILTPAYYDRPSVDSTLDIDAMTAKVRKTTMYRNGGFVSTSTATSSSMPTPEANTTDTLLLQVLQLNTDVLNKIYSNGVEAYFDYEKFKINMEKQKLTEQRTGGS